MRLFTKLFIIYFSLFFFATTYAVPVPVYSDNNKTIIVSKDNTRFIIKLLSNPSTGYSWFLQYYDKDLLTPINHVYTPENPELVGAGGADEWLFAVSTQTFSVPRTSSITLVYARPWNVKDVSIVKTFHFVTQ